MKVVIDTYVPIDKEKMRKSMELVIEVVRGSYGENPSTWDRWVKIGDIYLKEAEFREMIRALGLEPNTVRWATS